MPYGPAGRAGADDGAGAIQRISLPDGFSCQRAALAKLLPAGWVSNAATQGAAKDANIRLIFIDASNIVGPDNKLLGKGKDLLVYMAAPVKQADGSGNGQMILGGLSAERARRRFRRDGQGQQRRK